LGVFPCFFGTTRLVKKRRKTKLVRSAWPRVYRLLKNGKKVFLVDSRKTGFNGRRVFFSRRTVGLMLEPKIRLQVNVPVAAEAKGGRVGEGFQVAVCTGVVEQAF
jgi:hypothetical protein